VTVRRASSAPIFNERQIAKVRPTRSRLRALHLLSNPACPISIDAFSANARFQANLILGDWALVDELREIAGRKPARTGSDRSLLRSVLSPWSPLEEHTSMMPSPAAKVRILHFKYLRHSDMASVLITTFEIFTRVSPNNSLERLTERSVGIVTDRPSDVYELFVTLL